MHQAYVFWPDSHSSTSFFLIFTGFYQLCSWLAPCCMFGFVINFTQRPYCNNSQGTSVVLVKNREINRVYLRPLFPLILPLGFLFHAGHTYRQAMAAVIFVIPW
jgi:hypothetical protein